jgi:DNA-binding MarR family transcriptional regulator
MGAPAVDIFEKQFPQQGEVSLILVSDAGFLPRRESALPGDLRIVRTVGIDRTTPCEAGVLESPLLWVGVTKAPLEAWTAFLVDAVDRRPATAFVIEAVGDEAIDWAWSALGAHRCTILGNPTALERSLNLQAASGGLAAAAYDTNGESHGSELDRLRDEVGRIAHALANLTGAEADRMAGDPVGHQSLAPTRHPDSWGGFDDSNGVADSKRGYHQQPTLAPYGAADRLGGVTSLDIRKMIRMRRLRDKHFPSDLFSDPAWDMLLDLMVARIDRRPVSVSSLCIASAVPATTALRWIKTMTEAGLFERRSDPSDGRRVFIALSDESAQAMHAYFADMLAIGSLLPA